MLDALCEWCEWLDALVETWDEDVMIVCVVWIERREMRCRDSRFRTLKCGLSGGMVSATPISDGGGRKSLYRVGGTSPKPGIGEEMVIGDDGEG